jgi:hypothetical protein
MDELLVDLFLEAHDTAPAEIILDVDATDDPLHGHQEGLFFHRYYRRYCYLPLYIFCGEHLMCSRLRQADQDGAVHTQEELARIIRRVRRQWPQTRMSVRSDSGFCRNNGMDSPFADGIGCAKLEDQPTSIHHKGGVIMNGTTIGIDLAKNVFEVYVEDGSGTVVERKRLSRKKLLPWFANRPPALVRMEACGGAHYWARGLEKLGHTVRLMASQYVKPWGQTNKSDAGDALCGHRQ